VDGVRVIRPPRAQEQAFCSDLHGPHAAILPDGSQRA